MMKRTEAIILCVFLLVPLLWGCRDSIEPPTVALPDIEQFGAERYDPGEYVFPEVISASYTSNGIRETIQLDDSRLHRILDAISYSYQMDYTAWIQGHVDEDYVNTCVGENIPMLDIRFDSSRKPPYNTEFSIASRVIISANSYLLIVDTSDKGQISPGAVVANMHYPFAELIANSTGKDISELPLDWGNSDWVNVLKYAGF